jgi:hypothetical protein
VDLKQLRNPGTISEGKRFTLPGYAQPSTKLVIMAAKIGT